MLALLALVGCRGSERLTGKFHVGGYELFLHCVGQGEPVIVMDIAAGASCCMLGRSLARSSGGSIDPGRG